MHDDHKHISDNALYKLLSHDRYWQIEFHRTESEGLYKIDLVDKDVRISIMPLGKQVTLDITTRSEQKKKNMNNSTNAVDRLIH